MCSLPMFGLRSCATISRIAGTNHQLSAISNPCCSGLEYRTISRGAPQY